MVDLLQAIVDGDQFFFFFYLPPLLIMGSGSVEI